jgi:hypothetical protein
MKRILTVSKSEIVALEKGRLRRKRKRSVKRALVFMLLALAPLEAQTAHTSLSPAALASMAQIAVAMTGTVQTQKPHGYLIAKDDGTVFFLWTDAKFSVGDRKANVTVYPIGAYSYPTDDAGNIRTVSKYTDDVGVAADYALAKGVDVVSSQTIPVLPPIQNPQ